MPAKIVIESHIPFIRGVFEPMGAEVVYVEPEEINRTTVADADMLIVRTRTRCDSSLLAESRCSIVATATIGTDHIDLDWCKSRGIEVVNAPGCNAPAVAQWVLASLFAVDPNIVAHRNVLGIVGVGHVGSIVARWARSLGFDVLECDPPRAAKEGNNRFVNLDEVTERADIITLHTPMTSAPSPWPTHHMVDSALLERLERHPIIVNAARGGVTDTEALVEARLRGLTGPLLIDCWEGEPRIDRRLLETAAVATPHIAGYSEQGKIRATQMVIDAACRHFGFPSLKAKAEAPLPVPERVTQAMLAATCDPMADTESLRATPEQFENLRNHYRLRQEPV